MVRTFSTFELKSIYFGQLDTSLNISNNRDNQTLIRYDCDCSSFTYFEMSFYDDRICKIETFKVFDI